MNIKSKHVFLLGLGILVAFVFVLFLKNLNNPNLWFDEAAQFWMSLGLNPFSPPNSAHGGFWDIIDNNSKSNMDPGGFTLLLRLWMEISTNVIWLRLFAFIFFSLTCLLFVYFVYKWSKSFILTVALSVLLLISPSVIQYSFELRPYSWSFFSMLFCYFAIEKLRKSDNNTDYLLMGLILSVLMWGRYNCIIQVAATAMVLLLFRLKDCSNVKKMIANALCFGSFIVISLIGIVFITLQHQYAGTGTQEYVEKITIHYNPSYLLTPAFVLSISPLLIFLVAYFLVKKYFPSQLTDSLKSLFYFTIFQNALIIILSILGFYPYSFRHRWNVDLHVLSLLNLASIACVIYNILSLKKRVDRYLLPVTLILYLGVAVLYAYVPKFKYKEYEQTSYLLKKANDLNMTKISVPYRSFPNVRYLYEYGELKNEDNSFYPDSIFYYDKEENISWHLVEAIVLSHDSKFCKPDGWTEYRFEDVSLYVK
jgi:hypothetical protein